MTYLIRNELIIPFLILDLDSWHSFSKKKKEFLCFLALIDEQEKEEMRQSYEELHSNIEVSDIA